jgi:hypothetical protein
MIAPVNLPPSSVPPAQLQVTQGSSLNKLSNSAPDIAAPPNLKRKIQPALKIAQASMTLNSAVLVAKSQGIAVAQNSTGDLQNNFPAEIQYPKARILPSPLVTPKELPKSEQLKSDPFAPDNQNPTSETKLQDPGQLGSPLLTPKTNPESKEQQKPTDRPFGIEEQKPEKPEQVTPESSPTQLPETKQESKQQQSPLPLPSEVPTDPAPSPQNPSPTGPPPVEPGNYTGSNAEYYNQNYISPSISLGRDTLIGATSRFGIGRNVSVRPSLFLGNTARIAVPVTFDFGFNDNEQFEKNPLVVFHAGGGLDFSTRSGANTSSLNPLVVFGADLYLGEGASVLLQLGNTFNSDFVAVVGVGLQF